MTLEQEFQEEALGDVKTLQRKCGYNPTYFIRMVHDLGGVQAAKKLLASEDFQAGLITLWESDALEFSVEHMVLDPKYATLFTDDEKRRARKRLTELNFTPRW